MSSTVNIGTGRQAQRTILRSKGWTQTENGHWTKGEGQPVLTLNEAYRQCV